MDYGFLITDYDTLFGSYGIITKLNVSDYLVDEILSVQAEKLDLSKSEVVTNNTSYESLCAYQDDENCPSIAWNYSSGILSVFFSNNTYARFSYSGYRFPQKMTLTTTLDANESDLELIKCYTLKDLYADNNMMLPYNIRETIDILEQRLIDAI